MEMSFWYSSLLTKISSSYIIQLKTLYIFLNLTEDGRLSKNLVYYLMDTYLHFGVDFSHFSVRVFRNMS